VKLVRGSQCLVQFKVRPDVITPENVHASVFLSSMIDSPLDSLYHMIKSVFTPAIRETQKKSNVNSHQQIQTSLNELEQVLQTAGKPTTSSPFMDNVYHPKDELAYWTDITQTTSSASTDIERAEYFLQVLDPVKDDFQNLNK
jgi:dynein heavy chain 2, cytosolic